MGENRKNDSILTIGLWSQAMALVLGISLHASALLSGRALFYTKIFTPALDLLFVPLITVGGLLGIWGQIASPVASRGLRYAGLAVSAYFAISIPLHLKTLLLWSTAHFTSFPERYSLFIIPIQIVFILIVAGCLRALQATQADRDSQPQQLGGVSAAGAH